MLLPYHPYPFLHPVPADWSSLFLDSGFGLWSLGHVGFTEVNMPSVSSTFRSRAGGTLQQVRAVQWQICLNLTTLVDCQSLSDTVDAVPQLLQDYFYISDRFWNDCGVDLLACPSLYINRSLVLLHLDVWKGSCATGSLYSSISAFTIQNTRKLHFICPYMWFLFLATLSFSGK